MNTPRKPVNAAKPPQKSQKVESQKVESLRARQNRVKLAAWLESQRGRPQYRHAPKAGVATGRILRPLSKNFKTSQSINSLRTYWSKIVGERWAQLSKPEKFTASKHGRILHIRAPGPAAALIMASSGPIIERVNHYLGHDTVSQIRVIQQNVKSSAQPKSAPSHTSQGLSPLEAQTLQSGLASIKNPALKEALEALGKEVLSRDPQNTHR